MCITKILWIPFSELCYTLSSVKCVNHLDDKSEGCVKSRCNQRERFKEKRISSCIIRKITGTPLDPICGHFSDEFLRSCPISKLKNCSEMRSNHAKIPETNWFWLKVIFGGLRSQDYV